MSPYVDLAVGLALAFLILSLLVSGIQEGFTRTLNVRSKLLWAFLRDQFEGAVNGRSRVPSSVGRLLKMAWSRLPWRATDKQALDPRPDFEPGTPTPDATASAAPSTLEAFYCRLSDVDRKWGKNSKTHIASIPATRVATAFLELASMAGDAARSPQADGHGDVSLATAADQVRAWIESLQGTPLYRPLMAAWLSAGNDMGKFHDRVSEWFDGEMTRMSGLYRRHVRWIMLGIALFVALFTGFDSIAYARTMLDDNAFRSQVVAVAQGNPDRLGDLVSLCHALKDDEEVTDDTTKEASPAGSGTQSTYDGCFQEVLSDPSLTRILGDSLLVVTKTTADDANLQWRWSQWGERVRDPAHWPGLALTVAALMFGAPFWWDVVRRLTGRKSASTSR